MDEEVFRMKKNMHKPETKDINKLFFIRLKNLYQRGSIQQKKIKRIKHFIYKIYSNGINGNYSKNANLIFNIILMSKF